MNRLNTPLISRIASSKYLDRYAETESKQLSNLPQLGQLTPIVIPVFDEAPSFLNTVRAHLPIDQPILWIVVFNCPEPCNAEQQKKTQDALNQMIQHSTPIVDKIGNLSLREATPQSYLLTVDRTTQALPKKQGVGLARKIGCDIACRLMLQKIIAVNWVATTDADATLPYDYLSTLQAHKKALLDASTSALIFPFKHVSHHTCRTDPTTLATQLYEQHLNHYVNGLKQAGSPYAYHSLGSTLAIHPLFYAQVRGFPKRAAGEDFYLLNKLNKLAPVTSLEHPRVLLQTRLSQRTPFGTGPSVEKLLVDDQYLDGIQSYHPDGFKWLASLIKLFDQLAKAPPSQRLSQYTHALHQLGDTWPAMMQEIGLTAALPRLLEQHKEAGALRKAINDWFDAFKTMKFIHLIRDHCLGEALLRPATHCASR